MSDENLAPQEREWLANPEATVREALGDTVGDGDGLDERVFDALIARAKAEAWDEGLSYGWDDGFDWGAAGKVPLEDKAPYTSNPYRDEEATNDHP